MVTAGSDRYALVSHPAQCGHVRGDIVRSGDSLPLGALPCGGLAAVARMGGGHWGGRRLLGVGRLRLALSGLALVVFGFIGAPEGAGDHAPLAAARSQRDVRAAAPSDAVVPGVRELVGQRFVVAMRGTSPSAALLARIRRGEVGGVILFGANVESLTQLRRLTSALQLAAREAKRPPLLIATDQEGGRVRRLPWAGPANSAAELGRTGARRIRDEAQASGRALRLAGVNVDLAPVGDVPAAGSFMAIEQRTFASTPAAVAVAAVAFSRGLGAARVAATVKHFPGIGRATRNTDRAALAIAATMAELVRTDLLPFRSAIAAGAPIVMISNAIYPALDAKPAPWSPRIQRLLRRELGFTGVTITDALESAATTRGRALPAVAALAAQAGVDLLLLTGSEASSAAAFERVAVVAEQGRISAAELQVSYGRVLALKRTYG